MPFSSHNPSPFTNIFTAAEENLIVDLKENQATSLSWKEIHQRFVEHYPDTSRSQGGLQVHYARKLSKRGKHDPGKPNRGAGGKSRKNMSTSSINKHTLRDTSSDSDFYSVPSGDKIGGKTLAVDRPRRAGKRPFPADSNDERRAKRPRDAMCTPPSSVVSSNEFATPERQIKPLKLKFKVPVEEKVQVPLTPANSFSASSTGRTTRSSNKLIANNDDSPASRTSSLTSARDLAAAALMAMKTAKVTGMTLPVTAVKEGISTKAIGKGISTKAVSNVHAKTEDRVKKHSKPQTGVSKKLANGGTIKLKPNNIYLGWLVVNEEATPDLWNEIRRDPFCPPMFLNPPAGYEVHYSTISGSYRIRRRRDFDTTFRAHE